jgi:hypothetical protein
VKFELEIELRCFIKRIKKLSIEDGGQCAYSQVIWGVEIPSLNLANGKHLVLDLTPRVLSTSVLVRLG